MKQLGILDAAFINLEQTNTPQHVGGMGIYDPSTAPGGFVRFKDVIAGFERRLGSMPLFRTRLVEVPGGVDRPYWVKDANFDVEFHLRHIALPEPGDWRQLCIQVARLHSRPLDMSRPLWEAYIIEGLDNIPNLPKGCFAVYTKMHHSLVDGAGGSSFMAALHDLVPDPGEEDEPDAEPRLVDAEPATTELLAKASVNSVKNTLQVARGSVTTLRDLGKYALDIARDAPDVSAPKTILNKAVGPHRVFDAAEFPLEGFKDIKNAARVTINDVALGVVGGALKRYLEAKGELPEGGSLAAALPLNMRTRRGVTGLTGGGPAPEYAHQARRHRREQPGRLRLRLHAHGNRGPPRAPEGSQGINRRGETQRRSQSLGRRHDAGRRVFPGLYQDSGRHVGPQPVVAFYSHERLDLYFQRGRSRLPALLCRGEDGRLLRPGCTHPRHGHLPPGIQLLGQGDPVGAGGPGHHS
jgi:hypothetical protein